MGRNKSFTVCDGIKKSHGGDIFLNLLKFMRVSLGKDVLGFLYTQELSVCERCAQ